MVYNNFTCYHNLNFYFNSIFEANILGTRILTFVFSQKNFSKFVFKLKTIYDFASKM